jgi:membrane protein DedA with SNARE-associated domain
MSLAAQLWKYTALGATSIVFEEVNPILGGIAARHGQADLAAVIIAVALGTWAASLALYFVGLWRIDWVLARFPGNVLNKMTGYFILSIIYCCP